MICAQRRPIAPPPHTPRIRSDAGTLRQPDNADSHGGRFGKRRRLEGKTFIKGHPHLFGEGIAHADQLRDAQR